MKVESEKKETKQWIKIKYEKITYTMHPYLIELSRFLSDRNHEVSISQHEFQSFLSFFYSEREITSRCRRCDEFWQHFISEITIMKTKQTRKRKRCKKMHENVIKYNIHEREHEMSTLHKCCLMSTFILIHRGLLAIVLGSLESGTIFLSCS